MEEPFEKMAKEGEPMCDKPTAAAAPKKEEQDLPKLSAKEFRVYNNMAEHMDMFVRICGATQASKSFLIIVIAQSFPANVEYTL